MKRFTLFIFFILIALLNSSCMLRGGINTEAKIVSDAGNTYVFYEIKPNSGSCYVKDLNVYKADANELRGAYMADSVRQAAVPSSAQEAAQIGASILDETYADWSEAGTVCVFRNDAANAWIVHGQMTDRYSTAGCGVIAIEAATGEILYMVKSL